MLTLSRAIIGNWAMFQVVSEKKNGKLSALELITACIAILLGSHTFIVVLMQKKV